MSARLDRPNRVAAIVGVIETVMLVGYSAALGVAALNTSGVKSDTAPAVEISIFLIFAVLVGLITRALFRGSSAARNPFLMAQIFVSIAAWTLLIGDGIAVTAAGIVVGIVALVGLVSMILVIARDDSTGEGSESGP